MLRIIVLVLFISMNVEAQEKSILDLNAIKAFAISDSIKKDSLKTYFLTAKWDNHLFSPYKDKTIEFPFLLEFKDVFYASPLSKENVITSRYGWRWGRAHKGIDIDLISGENVLSMLDGKVRFVGYHSGHGKTVIIRHFNGLETVYAHLSSYSVKINETVSKGQAIGKGGKTGNARGSHVHIETIFKGNHINPEYLFSFDENSKLKKTSFWITQDWVTPFFHNSRQPSEFVYFDTLEQAKESKGIVQKMYVVKSGDTLYDISKKYKVSINRICQTNSIRKNSTLKIGQQLVLGY